MVIIKRDAGTLDLLDGAIFEVVGPHGDTIGSFSTVNGKINLSDLEPGNYTIYERIPPKWYLPSDNPAQNVTVTDGRTAELTFENEPYGDLRVEKSSDTGENLAGVKVQIKHIETGRTYTGVTEAGGAVQFTELKPGAYEVREIAGIPGWQADTESVKTVTVVPGEVSSVPFVNKELPGLRIEKYDSSNNNVLGGITFRIWRDGELLGDYRTGELGEILLTDLQPGTYLVQEVAADDEHVLDGTPQQVELHAGDGIKPLIFYNARKPGIHLIKVDAADPSKVISGAKFSIKSVAGDYGPEEFITDDKGEIDLSKLPVGAYLVTELSCPGYIVDEAQRIIQLDENENAEFVFTNSIRPSLHLIKKSADSGPLEGVTFRIARVEDGTHYLDRTTDSTGRAELKNLLPGVYEISEKSVPSPWLKDADPQLVTLYPNRDHTAYFKNHKRPIIEIIKENAVTFDRLANVPFRVWYASNNTATGEMNDLGVFYTDKNGRIELDGTKMGTLGLRDGWFRVQELEPLKGFAKADPDTQEAFIPAGQGHTFVFRNQPLSAICVWKYDSQHPNVAIEGAVFQIRYLSGNTSGTGGTVIGTYQTSKNGSFTATGLKRGTYIIIEELSSDGDHVIDTPPQTVYLSGEEQEVIHVRFGNSAKGGLLVKKVDASDGSPLSDVEFMVITSDGTVVGDGNGKFVTDRAGTFTVSGIEPGTSLVVKETRAKSGYLLDDAPQVAQIKAGQTVTLEFRNQKLGNLVLHKLSSVDKSPIEGAQFRITYTDGRVVDAANGQLSSNGLYTSNKEGQIVLSGITGTLICTEVSSAPGYAIDPNTRSQTVVVNPGDDTQQLYFYNNPLCSLTLSKVDSVTGKPVPNTQFTLKYANGEIIGKYTTGKDGTVTVSGLLPGSTVVAVETKVPDTHVLNPTPQTIVLKSGANTATSGGTGTNPGGSTGTGGGNNLDFENDPKMTLTIRKYIKGTDREPLAGVCFKVTTGDGAAVGPGGGTFYTNSAGEIVIEGLEPGTTVTAREISTVEGFVLDGEPKTVKIKAGTQAPELIFWNERVGTLVIQKKSTTGELLSGAAFLLTYADGRYVDTANGHLSSNGLYTTDKNGEIRVNVVGTVVAKEVKSPSGYSIDPATQTQTVTVRPDDQQTLVFLNAPAGNFELIKVVAGNKEKRIPNVTFEIRRADDDALIDTITTDSNGRATLQLEAENYYAVEKECPKEFKLDSSRHMFTVRNGENTTLTVENKVFSGILIHKTSAATGKGLYGVTFLLYDSSNRPIGQYTSDNQGYVYIEDLTDGGRYYLRELENPGYIPDTQMKTVYVKAGEVTLVEWENTPITGQFQVCKFAAEYNEVTGTPAGAPLKGAVYEISEARSGKVVDYITTDARGVAASKPLPLGRYKIVEVTAPPYWQLDPTPFDETLEYSGQIIRLSAYDKPSSLGVVITKRGNAQVLAGDQMRYDLTVANTSNVPLENFFWHDRVPTDAATAMTLTTGIYSARLNYRILYKTSGGAGYQVLASNLVTTSNYSFNLNAIPTQAGEVVTDIYFEFGKVPAGFQSTTGPTLTVVVHGSAANNYQLINRADAGGKFQGTWQTAQAYWATLVRKLIETPKPALPKTGY